VTDKVVRTERLELLDHLGRTRALFSCEEGSGVPSCTFIGADGETRLIVGLSWNEIPQIQLTAPDGSARLALLVRPEGMGMIVLTDGNQRTRTLTPTEP
jgi:hypothetical protein